MTLLNMVLLQWEDMRQLQQNPQAKKIPRKTQLILINMLVLEGKVPTFIAIVKSSDLIPGSSPIMICVVYQIFMGFICPIIYTGL